MLEVEIFCSGFFFINFHIKQDVGTVNRVEAETEDLGGRGAIYGGSRNVVS